MLYIFPMKTIFILWFNTLFPQFQFSFILKSTILQTNHINNQTKKQLNQPSFTMAQADYTKRTGKFRHIYGDLAKPENQYLEPPTPLTSGEGPYVKASGKFLAFSSNNPNKLYVRKLDAVGRLGKDVPCVSLQGMSGKIWDFDFSPFIDTMVALGDDSGKVAVANVPADGLTETLTTPTVAPIQVHGKKTTLVEFNPCASSILATGSFDRTVQLLNIETSSVVSKFEGIGDNIYSVKWNANGSLVAVTSKDKKLRIFDPRQVENDSTTQVLESFDGSKSSKVFWVPRLNWIGATGFTKDAKRVLKMWDLKDTSKPIYSNKIDQASSVLMPMWDDDNGVLYLAGKGEGSVNFGEIINDNTKYYPLSAYRVPEPQKGGGWVPKRALDVWKCEVQRFLKLTNKGIRPVSFIVPRKAGADVFQEDIYPDCVAPKPALGADAWWGGENAEPIRMQLDPAKRNDDAVTTEFVAKKTYAELEAENAELKALVAKYEAQLGITSNDDDQKDADAGDADATMASAAGGDDAPADADAAADDA